MDDGGTTELHLSRHFQLWKFQKETKFEETKMTKYGSYINCMCTMGWSVGKNSPKAPFSMSKRQEDRHLW